jgi:hypothetical protein
MQALLAVAALIVLLPPSFALPFTAKQSPGSTVAGTVVVDAFIQPQVPIFEATIRLYSISRVLQTKSDALGRFEFSEVPEGAYQLEVVRPGFKDKTIDLSVNPRNPTSQAPYLIALRIAATDSDCGHFDSIS